MGTFVERSRNSLTYAEVVGKVGFGNHTKDHISGTVAAINRQRVDTADIRAGIFERISGVHD